MSIIYANNKYNEMFLEESSETTNELNTRQKELRYLDEIEQACGNTAITIREIMSSKRYHTTSTQYKWLKTHREKIGKSTSLKKLRKFITRYT